MILSSTTWLLHTNKTYLYHPTIPIIELMPLLSHKLPLALLHLRTLDNNWATSRRTLDMSPVLNSSGNSEPLVWPSVRSTITFTTLLLKQIRPEIIARHRSRFWTLYHLECNQCNLKILLACDTKFGDVGYDYPQGGLPSSAAVLDKYGAWQARRANCTSQSGTRRDSLRCLLRCHRCGLWKWRVIEGGSADPSALSNRYCRLSAEYQPTSILRSFPKA